MQVVSMEKQRLNRCRSVRPRRPAGKSARKLSVGLDAAPTRTRSVDAALSQMLRVEPSVPATPVIDLDDEMPPIYARDYERQIVEGPFSGMDLAQLAQLSDDELIAVRILVTIEILKKNFF